MSPDGRRGRIRHDSLLTIHYNSCALLRQNALVRLQQPDSKDPFRCYLGREVSFGARPHVVEGCEVEGHNLRFRLRSLESGHDRHVTVLELLELMEGRGG